MSSDNEDRGMVLFSKNENSYLFVKEVRGFKKVFSTSL